MNNDKYVFSQLTSFLDRNQLLALMFGQLSNRESLRDLVVALEAHRNKCYCLGMGKHVTRSNLAKANESRDCRIFEDFAYRMIDEARRKMCTDIFKLDGNVYAFDSTTIDLCLSVFEWAKFRTTKGGVKVHTMYDVETQVPAFVHITPAAVHDVKAMEVIPYEPGSFYIFDRGYNDFKRLYRINVLSDAEIELTGYYPSKYYPERMRLIRYWDEEQECEFMFLTNAIGLKALLLAELYKNRWQIELFFKWLKQHLKIKKFWGTSENAVKTQIYVAIITYCLVAVVQHDMRLERSTYEILQILSISLTDKTPLRDLFEKTDYHDVKEQIDNSELLLFSC